MDLRTKLPVLIAVAAIVASGSFPRLAATQPATSKRRHAEAHTIHDALVAKVVTNRARAFTRG